jgi:hypothetical protein
LKKRPQVFIPDTVKAELGGTSFMTYGGHVVEGNYQIGDNVLLVFDRIDRRFLPAFKRIKDHGAVVSATKRELRGGKGVVIYDRGISARWYHDDTRWIYIKTVHGSFCFDMGQENVGLITEGWALSLVEQNGILGAFLFCTDGPGGRPEYNVLKFKVGAKKKPNEKHKRMGWWYDVYNAEVWLYSFAGCVSTSEYQFPLKPMIDISVPDPEQGPWWQGDNYIKGGLYNCNPKGFVAYLKNKDSKNLSDVEFMLSSEVVVTYGLHYSIYDPQMQQVYVYEKTYTLRWFMWLDSTNSQWKWLPSSVPFDFLKYESVYLCTGMSVVPKFVGRTFVLGSGGYVGEYMDDLHLYEALPIFNSADGDSIGGFALGYNFLKKGGQNHNCTLNYLRTTWDDNEVLIIGYDKGQGAYHGLPGGPAWDYYIITDFLGVSRFGGGHKNRFMFRLSHSEYVYEWDVNLSYITLYYLIKNKSVYVIDGVFYRWDQQIPPEKMDPTEFFFGRVAKELLVAHSVLKDKKVAKFDGSLTLGVDSRLHYAKYDVGGRFSPEGEIAGANDYGSLSNWDEPWPYGTKSKYFRIPRGTGDLRMWPADELFDYGLIPIPTQ